MENPPRNHGFDVEVLCYDTLKCGDATQSKVESEELRKSKADV
jgi:hypothetical protein